MVGTQLTQTRRMIKAMLNSGFKRNEFRVRTPYNKKVGAYDETSICCYCEREVIKARIPALLRNGISITEIVLQGKSVLYLLEEAKEDIGEIYVHEIV